MTPSPDSPTVTAQEIEKKLQESEDRRKSLEAQTLERLAEAERRAEEVRERKATLPPPEQQQVSKDFHFVYRVKVYTASTCLMATRFYFNYNLTLSQIECFF